MDLCLAAKTYGLREIFDWFATKYASVPYSHTHLFKALTYFDEAEQEPMSDMLLPLEWAVVRQFFLTHVRGLPRFSQ